MHLGDAVYCVPFPEKILEGKGGYNEATIHDPLQVQDILTTYDHETEHMSMGPGKENREKS
jgi:hypothetical protein